jgi:hypothetical protein
MKDYKIIITCGAYNAPCLYETAANGNQAVSQARERSGLSRFSNWVFLPKDISK